MENVRIDRNRPGGILDRTIRETKIAPPKMATIANGLSMMAMKISDIFRHRAGGCKPFYHLTAGE